MVSYCLFKLNQMEKWVRMEETEAEDYKKGWSKSSEIKVISKDIVK